MQALLLMMGRKSENVTKHRICKVIVGDLSLTKPDVTQGLSVCGLHQRIDRRISSIFTTEDFFYKHCIPPS